MEKLLEWLKDEDLAVSPLTLLLGIGVLIALSASVDDLVKELITTGVKRRLGIYSGVELLWIFYWLRLKYVWLRTKKDRIGIVIGVQTENIKVRTRLKNDLVGRLTQFINNNQLGDFVQVILLKNHQAERLTPILEAFSTSLEQWRNGAPLNLPKKWARTQKRIRAHYYVWGKIVERQDEEPKYFFDSKSLVMHRPIGKSKHTELMQDMHSVWHYQIAFAEKAEYKGFLFSADQMYLLAKYIIGIAAFISGDPFTALTLHKSLEGELDRLEYHPNIRHIRQRLAKLISEEHFVIARVLSLQGYHDEAHRHLDEAFAHDTHSYGALILKGYLEFTEEGSPEKALATIREARQYAGRDGTWRYSLGFLLMYLHQFDQALVVYDQIKDYDYENESFTLEQVYRFNRNLLARAPDHIQSYFILGFLKYHKAKNLPEALDYFDTFLERAGDQADYRILIGSARNYKRDIEEQMGLS